MRKLMIIIMLVLLLSACNKDNESLPSANQTSGDIAYFQLIPHTDEANTVVKALGVDYSMLFSLHLDKKKASIIEYWIDYYSEGSKVGTILKSRATLKLDGIKKTNLYLTLIKFKGNEVTWNMSLLQDQLYSSTKLQTTFQEKATMFVSPAQELRLPIGQAGELGVFILNNDEGDFDTSNIEDAIKSNEEVYVLRCKIS